MLSSLLNRVFPGVADSAAVDGCWIAKAISSQRKELDVFSEALIEIEKWEELQSLETKLQREHPLDRDHDPQYDRAVRDILTEACAFAWASSRGLGHPKFWDAEGTPDICLDTGGRIEVKAIHTSIEEAERMQRMLSGEIVAGHVEEPGPWSLQEIPRFSDGCGQEILEARYPARLRTKCCILQSHWFGYAVNGSLGSRQGESEPVGR